jgi:hypothetical protein
MGAAVKVMEPVHDPATHPPPPDPPPAPPVQLPLALLAVFVLECLIALYTLWPNYPSYVALLSLWIGVAPWVRWGPLKPRALGWSVPLVLGVVVGEVIGYFIVVPWDLTWLCLPRNRHAVAITMFLRLFCVLLALSAWLARGTAIAGSSTRRRRWADGGWLVFGLLLILPFACISSHIALGHRPYYEAAAESKARLQLGPDYADYRYFARSIDLVFRPGESVLIRASLIAYNPHLSDLQDVAVSWKEAWVGARGWEPKP